MSDLRTTAYQYRLHLTKGQQRILEQQLEECRWVYNQTLTARRDAWEQRHETLRLYDTQALLPAWKAERSSLKRVYSQVLQNVQVRVDLAFKAFFRRLKAGEPDAGFPRFKSFGLSFAPRDFTCLLLGAAQLNDCTGLTQSDISIMLQADILPCAVWAAYLDRHTVVPGLADQ